MTDVKRVPADAGTIPKMPLLLGLGGLLPFWGLALLLYLPHQYLSHQVPWGRTASDLALATYAAIIVSFLGGIRWGVAVAAAARSDAIGQYAIAVVPSLVAWALLVAPEPWRLVGLGILALALGGFDQNLVSSAFAPPWFGRLRLILSGGAGVALLLGAFAVRIA